MKGLRATVEFEVGRFVAQFLERFEDLLAVGLLFLYFFHFLTLDDLARRSAPVFLCCRRLRIFVPQIVQQRDFKFCSDHWFSSVLLETIASALLRLNKFSF